VAGIAIPATNPFLRPLPDIPLGRRAPPDILFGRRALPDILFGRRALPDIPFGRRRASSLREHELMKMLLSSITQLSPKKGSNPPSLAESTPGPGRNSEIGIRTSDTSR
jgi:hypothetical protein